MASAFQKPVFLGPDGKRISRTEAKRRIALGERVERKKGGTWYVRYRDENGKYVDGCTKATTKSEAKRIALELEQRAWRVRRGLEVPLPKDGGGTVAELMGWWLENFRKGKPGYDSELGGTKLHITETLFGKMTLAQFTSAEAEKLLDEVKRSRKPQTVAHVRGYLSRAYNKAIKRKRWAGRNPIADTETVRVPEFQADYLRAEEIVPFIAALPRAWVPFFVAAIFTGLRRGELFALRKSDVDFTTRTITVRSSHERSTTKGGKGRAVPIPSELVPFLKAAIEASTSNLVFPAPDGSMRSKDTDMPRVMRGAMARAGLVEGYKFVCRAKVNSDGKRNRTAPQCTHRETGPTPDPRRCPVHGCRRRPASVEK